MNKAIHYLTQSANQNYPDAQYYIKQDVDKTIQYFSQTLKKNDSKTQYMMRLIYLEGKYVTRDIDKNN